mgnify:CR=1 FL=1
MSIHNIHAAKTQLSKLLQRALDGEEIIIAKAGKPLVRLTPVETAPKRREPGLWAGQFTIPDDFNDPLPEFEELFYG